MTVYYEKHPITAERKAELRAKGYRILDAKFAPADWVDPEATKPKPKRSRKAVADDRTED